MIKELRKFPRDYVMLFALLVCMVAAFFVTDPNAFLQREVAIALGAVYFFWGVWHHHRADSVTKKVVLEYLFAGIFAAVLLILLTL